MRKRLAELKVKLAGVLPFLNERQRRVLVAAESISLGRGGVQKLAEITGISRQTIYRGLEDLKYGEPSTERIRDRGGGRKKLTEKNPKLKKTLEGLIEPTTRGDPESPLRWTCKSVRNLQAELSKNGFSLSNQSVANILHDLEYSLQANRKTSEGKSHPDRDLQFRNINSTVKAFLSSRQPVVSVDTKKKELIGNYKNGGQEWSPKGRRVHVKSHDFPDPKVPKAVPYGVYDIGRNSGWVNVGIDADTAEFAVESIRQWWRRMGKKRYPKGHRLLICADSGGSNGYRSHLWKRELQTFSNQERMEISVRHFPPGTSKWNKIEHRLFSYISMNWRGKPLISYETVVNLIAATTTKTGLTVKVRLDKRSYPRGIKVSKEEIKNLNICRETFHGEWNYTVKPQR